MNQCDDCEKPIPLSRQKHHVLDNDGKNTSCVCGACAEKREAQRHQDEAMIEHAYLKHAPRYTVFDDTQAREERDQELIDAGRRHLIFP